MPMVVEEGITMGSTKIKELLLKRGLNKKIQALLPDFKCSLDEKVTKNFFRLIRDALLTDMDMTSIRSKLESNGIATGKKVDCCTNFILETKDSLRSDEDIGKYFTDTQFKSYMLNATKQLEYSMKAIEGGQEQIVSMINEKNAELIDEIKLLLDEREKPILTLTDGRFFLDAADNRKVLFDLFQCKLEDVASVDIVDERSGKVYEEHSRAFTMFLKEIKKDSWLSGTFLRYTMRFWNKCSEYSKTNESLYKRECWVHAITVVIDQMFKPPSTYIPPDYKETMRMLRGQTLNKMYHFFIELPSEEYDAIEDRWKLVYLVDYPLEIVMKYIIPSMFVSLGFDSDVVKEHPDLLVITNYEILEEI